MKKKRVSACPDNERILRLFSADPAEREKEELADHLLDCPRCRLKLSLLNSIQKEQIRLESGVESIEFSAEEIAEFRKTARLRLRELERAKGPAARSFPRFRYMPPWAVAAGVIALFLAGFFAVRYFAPRDSIRDASRTAFHLISPLGRLKEAPSSFSWTPIDEIDAYSFRLIDANLQTILIKSGFKPSLTLDLAVRNKLEKGITYLWTVEARSASDQKLGYAQGTFIIE